MTRWLCGIDLLKKRVCVAPLPQTKRAARALARHRGISTRDVRKTNRGARHCRTEESAALTASCSNEDSFCDARTGPGSRRIGFATCVGAEHDHQRALDHDEWHYWNGQRSVERHERSNRHKQPEQRVDAVGRHNLHSGNDRDILQHIGLSEHGRLRHDRRRVGLDRIEQFIRQRRGIGQRRVREWRIRRQQHVVHPRVRRISGRKRTLQLIK
jgi:hypothetical protein